MNKEQFLYELQLRLSGLPQVDIDERIAFYSEMIDDRIYVKTDTGDIKLEIAN